MGGRPEKPHKPLLGYIPKDVNYGPRTIDLVRAIGKKAKYERLWIFDPSVKRWWTPEDFMTLSRPGKTLQVITVSPWCSLHQILLVLLLPYNYKKAKSVMQYCDSRWFKLFV